MAACGVVAILNWTMTNNLLLELAAAYDIEIKAPEVPKVAAK